MSTGKKLAASLFLLACAAAQAFAGNVFVLPASTFDTSVPVYTDNPFQSLAAVTVPVAVRSVHAKPDGSKFYVVSANDTDTILVFNAELNTVLKRISLATPVRAAGVSPDGKRLLVLAGALHVYDLTTSDDAEITLSIAPDLGVDPGDLAFSPDSKRAYFLSAQSERVTAFDLAGSSTVGMDVTVQGATAVAVAPNGDVYASGTGGVAVIDGVTTALRGRINFAGRPGKAVFTPNGRYALLLNQQPSAADGLAFLIDLRTRELAGVLPMPVGADPALVQLAAADNENFYAVSQAARKLVRITLDESNTAHPLDLETAGFLLASKSDVRAMAISNHQPAAKFIFVATAASLSRGLLLFNQSQDLSLATVPISVQLAGAASTAAPEDYVKFNDGQTVIAGSTTQPLVLRVWDVNGRPVFNKSVQFSTQAEGVTIETPVSQTTSEGFASTRITVPDVPGQEIRINVSLAEWPGAPIYFTVLTGGGSGGGGGFGALRIHSGNGQLVRANYITTFPLQVRLTDDAGLPIPGATVGWAVSSGKGLVIPFSSQTDLNGIAESKFIGQPTLQSFASYFKSTVTASATGYNPVDFALTTVQDFFYVPSTQLLAPALDNMSIAGQAGQTLTGAIKVQVKAFAGTQAGQGVPNVGVTLRTNLDPETSPFGKCSGEGGAALTNASGLAVCDLTLGGATGGPLFVNVDVGGYTSYAIMLTVTAGPPGRIDIFSGDHQSGDRGAVLPLPLVAQVSDNFGNLLPGTQVTWESVTPGGVIFVDPVTVADAEGKVRTSVRLGNTPGPLQVRVRAGSAEAIFNLSENVTVSSFTKVSGDSQSTPIGQAFASPIVVQLKGEGGQGIAGIAVAFSVASGSATLGSAGATTDSQGRASTTVTAGGTAGPIAITAAALGHSVTFNLTARPPGPLVLLQNIRNAVSGDQGVAPGAIIAIYGQGIAPGIQGSVVANGGLLIGPLPTTLAGVEVLFGSTSAPIYHVNNISGQEFVVVQAPFELAAGVTSVTVRVAGGSTQIDNVPVKTYQPGIFEMLGTSGQRWAILTRDDGSLVTLDSPLRKGVDRRLRMYAGGLGQTSPALTTNGVGVTGQNVLAQLSVYMVTTDGSSVTVSSAQPLVGVVGVFMLTIDVPATLQTGVDRPLVLGIAGSSGAFTYNISSAIPKVE